MMKFLLVIAMLLSSFIANANDWDVKCYEKDGRHGYDLAYIINVNGAIQLQDCTADKMTDPQCERRGYLKKVERQDETCLVLQHHNGDETMTGRDWELCREEQESLDRPHFVPVRVTDDRQESRIYCERKILKLL
jgi:hypothetical protein